MLKKETNQKKPFFINIYEAISWEDVNNKIVFIPDQKMSIQYDQKPHDIHLHAFISAFRLFSVAMSSRNLGPLQRQWHHLRFLHSWGLSRDICLHYPLCPLLLPPTAHHLSSTKVEKRKLGCIVHGRRILFSLQLICFWAALKQRIQTRYIIVWGQTKPQNLLSCHVMAIYFSYSSLRNPCSIIKSTRSRYILIGYSCVLFTFYQNWAKDVWTF